MQPEEVQDVLDVNAILDANLDNARLIAALMDWKQGGESQRFAVEQDSVIYTDVAEPKPKRARKTREIPDETDEPGF